MATLLAASLLQELVRLRRKGVPAPITNHRGARAYSCAVHVVPSTAYALIRRGLAVNGPCGLVLTEAGRAVAEPVLAAERAHEAAVDARRRADRAAGVPRTRLYAVPDLPG